MEITSQLSSEGIRTHLQVTSFPSFLFSHFSWSSWRNSSLASYSNLYTLSTKECNRNESKNKKKEKYKGKKANKGDLASHVLHTQNTHTTKNLNIKYEISWYRYNSCIQISVLDFQNCKVEFLHLYPYPYLGFIVKAPEWMPMAMVLNADEFVKMNC